MIGNRIKRPMNLAIKMARKADHKLSWHLGAVITQGKEIVSVGFNRDHTHPKSGSKFHYLHAEVDVIIGVPQKKLDNASLFVARLGYDFRSKIMMAKPCSYCARSIIRANIRWCYYTIDEYHIGLWDVANDTETVIYTNEIE